MGKETIYTPELVFANARQYVTDEADIHMIEKAYQFANDLHIGQKRKSGEDYIIHPIQVAGILVSLQMDPATIAAGFLHDVVEDTDTTLEDITREFNEVVMHLVDGVTKLGQIKYKSLEQAQAENHRKMFVAMTNDFRVILIKFADRLHNMRTLKYLSPDKQVRIANETLEIFTPLANRLGISEIQWELEDMALRYLDPTNYYKVVNLIKKRRGEREDYLNEVMAEIRKSMAESMIEVEVFGRPKHIYSIYKKMVIKGRHFDEIYDLIAVRVIVHSIKDCYAVLGGVHSMWTPINGRLKDFIAMPKSNMYQSIHTTVIGPKAVPFEIQIRTEDMHRIAQFGIAAHWAYKQGKDIEQPKTAEKKLSFFREFVEIQEQDTNDVEFMQSLKADLLADLVYVYTPTGDVCELPKGSVTIDFAYRVHSEIGNKTTGAKVNGKIVPLDTTLKTGDIIEILTAKNSPGPSRDWLKVAQSPHTRNKIKQFFKKQNREENVNKGRDMIERELREMEIDFKEAFSSDNLKRVLDKYNFSNESDLYAAVGYSGINASQVATRLADKVKKQKDVPLLEQQKNDIIIEKIIPQQQRRRSSGVIVPGLDNLLIRLSRCCNPIPGDEIVGFITKGRGVSVHRADCQNISKDDSGRLIDVEWDRMVEEKDYTVEIEIIGFDRSNLLSDVLAVVSESKTQMASVFGRTDKRNGAVITMSLRIQNMANLEKLFKKISQVPEVYDVRRILV